MIRVRRASGPTDLDLVIKLRREAITWLRRKNTDQWSEDWPDTDTMIAGFARDLDEGETWIAESDRGVLGIGTINGRTNHSLWTDEEVADALFVHRLTRSDIAQASGVGEVLLDVAGHLAEREGRRWIRLDAWTTNEDLHAYYRRMGFRHVRTVADHHSPSAACFERPASVRLAAPHWVLDEQPIPTSTRD